MTIDWTDVAKEIARILNVRDVVLLIVIFVLLRILSILLRHLNEYSKEIFSHNSTMARLTNLLETLVFNKRTED